MYAGTKVRIHEIRRVPRVRETNETIPLFLCVFSSDKGTEELTSFTKTNFDLMYGTSSDFFKYGQPLLQAHDIANAGGKILGKRIVAEDSTLANVVINAEVTKKQKPKLNSDGQPLYIQPDGSEKTDVTANPAMITYAEVKYTASTVENAKKFSTIETQVESEITATKFPIIIIADNGRGKSLKKFRIVPDYDVSKSMQFMLYNLDEIEGTEVIESERFSIYSDAIASFNGTQRNMALTKLTSMQFDAIYQKTGMEKFVQKLAEITGYSVDDLYKHDILFGKTVKGKALPGLVIDTTSADAINLNTTYGINLQSGTNGAFADAPFPETTPTSAWEDAAAKFLSGNDTDVIWDLDQYKIDFCCDANYPAKVKRKLEYLANWREDFFYFRDLNTNINTMTDVNEKINDSAWLKSPYIGDYMTCYDIIDQNSKKQISVTMIHGIAPLLVRHYQQNIAAPIAGEFNNFVITEAIEGTLRFTPRVTPNVNQKEIIDELRVNYATYSSDRLLTVQSTYTSQDHDGPLSYSSNVILTQMCIKDIRRYTPKIRFMLMDSSDGSAVDFSKYRELIKDNVISKYSKFFKSVDLVYTRDDEMIANKIFNASLYCYYKDFPQGEIFDVFAIEGSPTTVPANGGNSNNG